MLVLKHKKGSIMGNKCVKCNNCANVGWSKRRGNIFITILFTISFLIPAMVYEVWRTIGLGACSKCGSKFITTSNLCNPADRNPKFDTTALYILSVGFVIWLLFILYLLK